MQTVSSSSTLSGQECFVTGVSNDGTVLRGTSLRFTRETVVFEICSPSALIMASEVLSEFTIVLGERTVYQGRAVARKLISTGLMQVCEADLGEGWIDLDLFRALAERGHVREQFSTYLESWHRLYHVLPEIKLHTGDMQMFLLELRAWAEQVELGVRAQPSGDRAALEVQVAEEISMCALPYLNGLFDRLEALAGSVDDDRQALHRSYVRRQLHPLLLCAPFAYRTFTKPLGFAGDYEMVRMIWRNGQEGASLYAKVVNSWFLRQAPAAAHRNRLAHVGVRLLEETVRTRSAGRSPRILSLGCGPAVEVQEFLATQPASDDAEFYLLDFNEETLQNSRSELEAVQKAHRRRARLHPVKKSVHQILKEGSRQIGTAAREQFDLVYCAGLFDYLPDSVCQRLMTILGNWVAPDGLLLVTNVDLSNPRRYGMEFVLDWHLIHRQASDLQRIFGATGLGGEPRVTADRSGVNLILEARRNVHG